MTPTKNESLPELPSLTILEMSELMKIRGIETKSFRDHEVADAAYRAGYEAALTREAPTERVGSVLANCPDCKGAGEVMLPVWTPDPQDGYDQLSSCPRCGGNGGLLPASLSDLLHFTEHCISASEEGEDYSVPREWLDAMTTIGVMKKAGRGRWSVSDQAATVVAILRAATATPPAPQRQSSNPSGLSSESDPLSSEQRLAQGEAEAWQKIHVLTSVMEFRSLTEAERRELHECHLTIREAPQPPHQNRGEVEKRARELLANEYADDPTLADKVREGTSRNGDVPRAIRAITAALTERPRPTDDELWDQTIRERDEAEEALGDMFQAVTGRPAEWSSAWHYADALEEVEDHIAALTEAKHVFVPTSERGLATGDTPTLADVYRQLDPAMWAVVCAAIAEAKRQGPGEAVAFRVWDAVNNVPNAWANYPAGLAKLPNLKEGFRYEIAYAAAPQVEAKQQGPEQAVGHGYLSKGSGKLCLVDNPAHFHLPHVFPLYTAPQVEAKQQAGDGESGESLLDQVRYAIRNAERHPHKWFGVNVDTLKHIESAFIEGVRHE